MSHICIIHANNIRGKEPNWKLKERWRSAGSGVCVLTNQSRWGALKETGAKKAEFQKFAALESMRKLMSFLSIKACKAIPLVTKNLILNLKMS